MASGLHIICVLTFTYFSIYSHDHGWVWVWGGGRVCCDRWWCHCRATPQGRWQTLFNSALRPFLLSLLLLKCLSFSLTTVSQQQHFLSCCEHFLLSSQNPNHGPNSNLKPCLVWHFWTNSQNTWGLLQLLILLNQDVILLLLRDKVASHFLKAATNDYLSINPADYFLNLCIVCVTMNCKKCPSQVPRAHDYEYLQTVKYGKLEPVNVGHICLKIAWTDYLINKIVVD